MDYESGSLLHLADQGRLPRSIAHDVFQSRDRVPNRSTVRVPRRHKWAAGTEKLVMGLTSYGEGIDFSTIPNFGCVRGSGRNFVCMYIKWVGRGTVEAARAAGLRVVPIYETTGVDYRGGYGSGVNAAHAFDAWCNANGYGGAAGYMTYDTDVLGYGQYGLAAAYADGWRDTLGRGRVGGYGQNGLVTRLYAEGHIGLVWVTYAWSGGALGPEPIHCYQNPNDIYVCGVQADRDRTFTPTMGAIGEGSGPPPPPPPPPVQEDEMARTFIVPPGGIEEVDADGKSLGKRPAWIPLRSVGDPPGTHYWYSFGIDSLDDPGYVQMCRLAMGGRGKGFRAPLAPAGGWGPYDVPIGTSYIGWIAQDDDDGISVLPYEFPGHPNVPVTVTVVAHT